MWPFTKSQERPSALLERLETLERQYRDLRVDWESMFDKFDGLLRRWNKRLRDAEKPDLGGGGTPTPPPNRETIDAYLRAKRRGFDKSLLHRSDGGQG